MLGWLLIAVLALLCISPLFTDEDSSTAWICVAALAVIAVGAGAVLLI